MKKLVLILFIGAWYAAFSQEKPVYINATFTFFQDQDTIDMKKPEIKLSYGMILFDIKSRIKIHNVEYKITAASASGKELGTARESNGYFFPYTMFQNSMRPGDKLSVEILYMQDEQGKRYKPAKTSYGFVVR